MAERDPIQHRSDALSALERARVLRDGGDYKGARAALAACLQILPDHPEAVILRDELGQGDDSNETFQVSDWMEQERARASGDPTDQDDLRYQLRQAIGEQQHEKIISLGEALLTIAGPNTLIYHDQVAASAELLVEQNDPERLDVALGWADTWWRVCHDPRAKDYTRALKARIATVTQREQQIHEALASGKLSELMTVVHELMSSRDRLQTTAEVLTLAEARLRHLRRNVAAAKQAVETAIPGRIDEARRLLEDVTAAEPTAANQARLADLQAREQRLSALHLTIEEALDRGHLTPLEQACSRLRSSGEALSTSLQLLERAEQLMQRLSIEREANLRAFEGGMEKDLEQAVVALTALRRIDPQHPHCAQLPKLERRLRELEDHHQALERRLSDNDIRGVHEALRRISTRSDRLSVTPKLVTRAERYLLDAQRQERRHRHLVYSITAGVLIALALPLGWWLVDRWAWYAALDRPDPGERLQAVTAFIEHPVHLFYGQAAAIEQAQLVDQLQDAAWNAATGIQDPAQRIPALQTFAADYPQSRHADKVEAAIEAARQSIDGRAFRLAIDTPDPMQRVAALEAFLAQAVSDSFVPLATEAIEAARLQDDAARWQRATATDQAPAMIERLQAYLDTPGPQTHAAEAAAMVAELERAVETDGAVAADRAAWSRIGAAATPEQRLAAAEAYLATPDHHLHRAEAMALVERLRSEIDAAAWATASADTGSLPERIARLEAYLARRAPPPAHAVAARSVLADLQRAIERERWMTVSAPGTTLARLARLDAYLAESPDAPYADDARLLRKQLADRVDYAVYAKAQGVLAAGQRVLALQAYLAGDTSMANADQARTEIRRALAELAKAPIQDLAAEPVAVLVQVDPEILARLPRAVQLTLPATTLRTLPPGAQAALPLSAFAALPPGERIKVPRRPPWCTRSGVDATGAWAEIDLRARATMRFRLVLGGAFEGADATIASEALWVAESETTQAQWRAIAGGHPSRIEAPQLPVHRITLGEAKRFLQRLGDLLDIDQQDPFSPRLPTPTEQRFIAETALTAAVEDFPRPSQPDAEHLAELAWFGPSSQDQIQDPRARQADAWGLYGIFGNVAEWCEDGTTAHPQGGHYAATASACGPGSRLAVASDQRDPRVGMRVVFTAR